jgi:uncharacterized protein (DUF1330 family)
MRVRQSSAKSGAATGAPEQEKNMKTRYVVALAVLAGIALGAFASRALMAQKPPTGYYIAEVFDVTNQDDFNTYAAGVPATIAKYGGKYIVRGGKTESLEGEPPKRIIVMTFDSAEAARKWYESPEYSAIKPIRQRSAKARGFIVEGVAQ